MGGFSQVAGSPLGTVMNADNVSFDGTYRGGVITTNGELLIGSTALPHIRVGSLTSPSGSITIGYSSPNITLEAAGTSFIVDAGTSPVVPDGSSQITLTAGVAAAGTTPIRTDGIGANSIRIEAQISQAIAAADSTKIGLSNFDSTVFTVAASGFVSLVGGSFPSVQKFVPNSGTSPVTPTAGGQITLVGQDGITTVGSANTLTITPRGQGTKNMFLGQLAGNLTLTGNSNQSYGYASLQSITSGQANTAIGSDTLTTVTTTNGNTALGHEAGRLITGELNVAIGYQAMENYATGTNNVAVGTSCMGLGSGGSENVAVGNDSLYNTSGSFNVCLGRGALNALTSGASNTALGDEALTDLLTGTSNVSIGRNSGSGYTGAESNNILITNAGTLGESNAMHLGTTGAGAGQVNKTYIAGINGVTASNPLLTTINSSTDQMGVIASVNQAVLTTSTTGVPSLTSIATNGQLIIGSTAGNPAAATLTAGTGIAITNGSNSITVAATGGGLTWNVVSSNQTGLRNNGYVFIAPGGALTVSLPTVASTVAGDVFRVALDGATSWQITQAASQQIRVAAAQTTAGAGGTITSTAQGDALELVAESTTKWVALSYIGTLTLV